jgi:hypothetical protein
MKHPCKKDFTHRSMTAPKIIHLQINEGVPMCRKEQAL